MFVRFSTFKSTTALIPSPFPTHDGHDTENSYFLNCVVLMWNVVSYSAGKPEVVPAH